VFDLSAEAMWPAHPYGYTILGTRESVAAMSAADLRERHDASYVPANCVIAAAGNLEHDVLLELLAREGWFEAAGPGAPPPLPAVPPAVRGVEARHPRDSAQVHLVFATDTVPFADPRRYALMVAANVLGGGMSSRLFRTLRDAEGLAYSVGSVYPTRRAGGRLVVHIGTAPENVPAAESGIRREIERLASEPVPEDELERTKTYLIGSFLLDRRTNGRQSFSVAFYEAMGVGADYVTRYPGLLHAVGAPDVLRVARRHLVEPAVVSVGPAA
jgi:predicted Zn-dependent peptidase